jgi:hypothetical protein
MPNPTRDQALQIAKAFAGFATTVENYRFDHFNALTADSGRCRSAFRGDGDRHSELMRITIPR